MKKKVRSSRLAAIDARCPLEQMTQTSPSRGGLGGALVGGGGGGPPGGGERVFVCFFQAEDGIRDFHVTGVQTCALPISAEPIPAMMAAARLRHEQEEAA